MMYRECPLCGAHLDPGEPCDCGDEQPEQPERDKKEDAPGGAGTPSGPYGQNTVPNILTPAPPAVNGRERLMKIRLYQINLERDPDLLAYMYLEWLIDNGYASQDVPPKLDAGRYELIFEGDVDCGDLEDVYYLFNSDEGLALIQNGRPMSVSDVVEIEDRSGTRTQYFCDSIGFKRVELVAGAEGSGQDEEAEHAIH